MKIYYARQLFDEISLRNCILIFDVISYPYIFKSIYCLISSLVDDLRNESEVAFMKKKKCSRLSTVYDNDGCIFFMDVSLKYHYEILIM